MAGRPFAPVTTLTLDREVLAQSSLLQEKGKSCFIANFVHACNQICIQSIAMAIFSLTPVRHCRCHRHRLASPPICVSLSPARQTTFGLYPWEFRVVSRFALKPLELVRVVHAWSKGGRDHTTIPHA